MYVDLKISSLIQLLCVLSRVPGLNCGAFFFFFSIEFRDESGGFMYYKNGRIMIFMHVYIGAFLSIKLDTRFPLVYFGLWGF